MGEVEDAIQRGKDLQQASDDALMGRETITVTLTRQKGDTGSKVSLVAHPDDDAEMLGLTDAIRSFIEEG